jgi:hypothetical protein
MNEKQKWQHKKSMLNEVKTGIYEGISVILKDCIIGTIDLGNDCEELILENCIIDRFLARHTQFSGQCIIRGCVFREDFAMTDGGHNQQEMIIENNIFQCRTDFIDSFFTQPFTLRNNIFIYGSNLLAYKGTSTEVEFIKGCTIDGNIGALDVEG